MMNEEQFKTLAQYEENFRTAINSKWARHPGRTALATINEAYSAALGVPPRRVNYLCQQCVLDLLRNAGKAYFNEKARREAEVEAQLKATREEAEMSEAKPKAKKTPARKPKAAKIEK